MRLRIYQINMERDKDRKVFLPYTKTGTIDSRIYDLVFDGTVSCKTLDEVYYLFNMEHPKGYKGRSLSVSDIVEQRENGKSKFYFCDSIGFKEVMFEPMKTTVLDLYLVPDLEIVKEKVKEGFYPMSKGYDRDGIYYDDRDERRCGKDAKRYYPAFRCQEGRPPYNWRKMLYPLSCHGPYGDETEMEVVSDDGEWYLQIRKDPDSCYIVLPDGTCHMV